MFHERVQRLCRVLAWWDPHAYLRARDWYELVHGVMHRRRIECEHRDRGHRPHAICEPAVADKLHALPRAGLLAQLRLGEIEGWRFSADEPFDRDVALVVMQRCE